MKQNIQVMMDIIKSEICGTEFDPSAFLNLSGAEQAELAKIAMQNSVAQLLGDALGKNPLTQKLVVSQQLRRSVHIALVQTAQLDAERDLVCQELSRAGIEFIQLKGARIRSLYPEAWMRTSCDNDILVHECDAERAAELLIQNLDYRLEMRNYHDISMYSPSNAHLELHFYIKENMKQMDGVLEQVWQHSRPVGGMYPGEYAQSNEFFLLYHVAHMVCHFVGGGCGIRPFLDLLLLRKQADYNEAEVVSLCEHAGIDRFYENAVRLVDVWFCGEEHNECTRRMENYVCSGGIYGNLEQHDAAVKARKKSKLNYILYRIFLPYANLCVEYPKAKKHKWLAPFFQIDRWVKKLYQGKLKKAKTDLKKYDQISPAAVEQISRVLKENGLL